METVYHSRISHGLLACALACCVLPSCSDKRYDIDEGFNKEFTLFEEEIVVPVGSIGPVTVGYLLQNLSLGGGFEELFKVDEDGEIRMHSESVIYAVNVFRLEQEAGDVSQDFTFSPGDNSGYPGGVVSLLGMLGLHCLGQQIEFTATNPLWKQVPVRAQVEVSCLDKNYETSFQTQGTIDQTLRSNTRTPATLLGIDLPAEIRDPVQSVALNGLELDLPANPTGNLYEENEFDVFSFGLRYTYRIGVGEGFHIPLSLRVKDARLPIGKYKLHQCEASLELENTLPVSVTVNSVKVLRDTEEQEVDENIVITGGITVGAGSPQKPSVNTLKLEVQALEGTIPDIHGLEIDLEVNGAPGFEDVALSSAQGLSIKSSSARLRGGFTITL
jgi:hypothetical protein